MAVLEISWLEGFTLSASPIRKEFALCIGGVAAFT